MCPDMLRSVHIGQLEELKIDFERPLASIVEDLEKYEILLHKWQNIQNLVSRETLNEIWHRHFYDSLQLFGHIKSDDLVIVDFGSGGGFPIIPIAIASTPGMRTCYLVESNKRKASFLRTVSRELGLKLHIHDGRAEEFTLPASVKVDVITSRATSALDNLLGFSYPLWNDTTRALFHKGAEFGAELCKARANWQFDMVSIPSKTNSSSVILDISCLERLQVV